jgi:hypothetical protein
MRAGREGNDCALDACGAVEQSVATATAAAVRMIGIIGHSPPEAAAG